MFGPVGAALGGAAGAVAGGGVQASAYHTFIIIQIGRRFLRIDFCDEGLEWIALSEDEMQDNLRNTQRESGGLKQNGSWMRNISIDRIISALEKFKNKTYDIMNYNCQHFCDDFIDDLIK